MHVLYGLFGVAVLFVTCLWNGTGFGYTMSNMERLLKEEESRVFSHKPDSSHSSGYVPSSVSTDPVFPTVSSAATSVQAAPASFSPANMRQIQENVARQAAANARRQLENSNNGTLRM